MKVFLSDIHLGDGSKSDDFHRDVELIKFLEWTDGRASEIIILGDLFELWQARLEKIFWAHADVIRALDKRSKKITYVYGNHDALPFAKLNSEVYVRDGIVAMHGHQFDKYNKNKNPMKSLKWPIGKYITVLIAGLERWIHPDADVWLDKMRKKFGDFKVDAALLQNKAWNCTDLDQVIEVTDNLKQRNLAPISIFGHNHEGEVCVIEEDLSYGVMSASPEPVIEKRIYCNCGTWVDDEYPTFITVTENEVQLKDGLSYTENEVQLRDGLSYEVMEKVIIP